MIEKISLALVDESGNIIRLENDRQITMKLEIAIAETFGEIRNQINAQSDEEIKTASRFDFAVALKTYLEEMKNDAGN